MPYVADDRMGTERGRPVPHIDPVTDAAFFHRESLALAAPFIEAEPAGAGKLIVNSKPHEAVQGLPLGPNRIDHVAQNLMVVHLAHRPQSPRPVTVLGHREPLTTNFFPTAQIEYFSPLSFVLHAFIHPCLTP